MITFNGFNCWSPLLPTAYTLLSKNGIATGPVSTFVDKLIGNPIKAKVSGTHSNTMEKAMATWNLVWLLHPYVDSIPDVIKKHSFDGLMQMPTLSEDELVEIFTAAIKWQAELLQDPVIFVNKATATRSLNLRHITLPELKARADSCRRESTQLNSDTGNVIHFNFRKPE